MYRYFSKVLPASTIIISYLFVCGGVYLLGFWGTFDVDAFSLVELWDIPKNFVGSFMFSGGVGIVLILTMVFFINKLSYFNKENNTVTATVKQTVNRRIAFLGVIIIAIILFFFLRYNFYYWLSCAAILSWLLIAQIVRMPSFINLVNNYYLRIYVTMIVITTPVICFVSAKKDALAIYKNSNAQIIKIDDPKITSQKSEIGSLKLLGFLGDKLIVSTLDNEKIFVLNKSAFDVIEIDN